MIDDVRDLIPVNDDVEGGLEEDSVMEAAKRARRAQKEMNSRFRSKGFNSNNPEHWTETVENDDVERKVDVEQEEELVLETKEDILKAIRAVIEGGK